MGASRCFINVTRCAWRGLTSLSFTNLRRTWQVADGKWKRRDAGSSSEDDLPRRLDDAVREHARLHTLLLVASSAFVKLAISWVLMLLVAASALLSLGISWVLLWLVTSSAFVKLAISWVLMELAVVALDHWRRAASAAANAAVARNNVTPTLPSYTNDCMNWE
jgi:hypothetical protein